MIWMKQKYIKTSQSRLTHNDEWSLHQQRAIVMNSDRIVDYYRYYINRKQQVSEINMKKQQIKPLRELKRRLGLNTWTKQRRPIKTRFNPWITLNNMKKSNYIALTLKKIGFVRYMTALSMSLIPII